MKKKAKNGSLEVQEEFNRQKWRLMGCLSLSMTVL